MRKNTGKLITITFRAPEYLSEMIDKSAKKEDRTKSNFLVHYLLNNLPKKPHQ